MSSFTTTTRAAVVALAIAGVAAPAALAHGDADIVPTKAQHGNRPGRYSADHAHRLDPACCGRSQGPARQSCRVATADHAD